VAPLFREWLDTHAPLKADHVMSRVRALRGGRENDPRFGSRMRGTGTYAQLFAQRFALAMRKLGLAGNDAGFELDTSRFHPPGPTSPQQNLF
jgi:DNA repair photolyase